MSGQETPGVIIFSLQDKDEPRATSKVGCPWTAMQLVSLKLCDITSLGLFSFMVAYLNFISFVRSHSPPIWMDPLYLPIPGIVPSLYCYKKEKQIAFLDVSWFLLCVGHGDFSLGFFFPWYSLFFSDKVSCHVSWSWTPSPASPSQGQPSATVLHFPCHISGDEVFHMFLNRPVSEARVHLSECDQL